MTDQTVIPALRVEQEPPGRDLLEIADLEVAADAGTFWRTILSGVSLRVGAGETVGVVGESGSGKSMMAKAVVSLLPKGVQVRKGHVRFRGEDLVGHDAKRMRAIRGRGIGLLLQDPFTMLNPVLPCGEQIVEGLRTSRRLSRHEASREATARLAEVGMRDPAGVAQSYPFQLSGGMRQRVALAAALSSDPQLLIADEPSTALDVTTQAEILELLRSVQEARGMGLILITHDLRVAFSVCARVYVLYAGSVLEAGPTGPLQEEPLHPYTLGLLLSEPSAEGRVSRLAVIEGSVPSPDDVRDRCAFVDRCRFAATVCRAGRPELRAIGGTRESACVRIAEIRADMRQAQQEVSARLEAAVAAPAPSDDLVVVKDLRKVFRLPNRREVVALEGVSLHLSENESVGLVGESGSGKTTVGRCLVGLETATSGELTIGGLDAHDYGACSARNRRALRSMAQIIFQDPYSSLDPKQTVGAALAETLRVNDTPPEQIRARVDELLESVGLPLGYAKRRPATLSGGERQRVAIARALAVDPRLIVCDEPVSALDVSVQAQVLNLLRRLREERRLSYLFITHDLAVVRQVVDRIYVLYEGRIVEEGPVDKVLDAPSHSYTKRLIASIPASANKRRHDGYDSP
ncbi:MAG: ABC transporter ATP-binding protein [Actinomycetota bacterium]|jgi:peptide/nickel transport system ATP-binding protein|nr:ABC transporter ATP-binding protein [Actinomycetota bacterium]